MLKERSKVGTLLEDDRAFGCCFPKLIVHPSLSKAAVEGKHSLPDQDKPIGEITSASKVCWWVK